MDMSHPRDSEDSDNHSPPCFNYVAARPPMRSLAVLEKRRAALLETSLSFERDAVSYATVVRVPFVILCSGRR